jgi:hypothetical protein
MVFTAAQNATYNVAYATGIDSYMLMFTMISMYQQMAYDTTYRAPINTFYRSTGPSTPDNQIFSGSNTDTIYDSLWGNLKDCDGLLLTTMNTKHETRWLTIQIMDFSSEVITNLPGEDDKSKKSKDYLLVGPDSLYKDNDYISSLDAKVIKCPTNLIWIVARTEIVDHNVASALAIANQLEVVVINGNSSTLNITSIDNSIYTSLEFYKLGLYLLGYSGYYPSQQFLVDQMLVLGLNPKVPLNISALSLPISTALTDAAYTARTSLPNLSFFASQIKFTNFFIGGAGLGHYANNITRKAYAQYNGYASNVPQEQFYLSASQTGTGAVLDCSLYNYTMHFNATQLPAVNPTFGFWSITIYNSTFGLYNNPLDKYAVGSNNNDLIYNLDGSLDLYFQQVIPSVTNNYLYCDNIIKLILRAYSPLDSYIATPVVPPVTVVV